jgi:hypothetical protein
MLLEIIKSYRLVLATGHVSSAETFALVDRARQQGIEKIVVTHPLFELLGCHLSIDEQCQIVEKGAFIEHCFVDTLPLFRLDPQVMVKAVKAVGAEHCILSTDMGQSYSPTPVEGMRIAIATMLRCGLSEREIELMIKVNPSRFLDLD